MIVVTGAAGFIGSQLAMQLAADGVKEMLLVDHPLRQEKATNLQRLSAYPFLTHSTFISELEHGLLKPSLVFHLGACSDTTATDAAFLSENNLIYTKRLWLSCSRLGARLLYASSAATYGDGSEGFDDDSDLTRLKPLNLYADFKHRFDVWAAEQARPGGVAPPQWVGFKFFNVFGPGEAHKGRMASMAYHGYLQITSNNSVTLFKSHRDDYDDGNQARDFVYVRDVVSILLKTANSPGINGIFNLGTGLPRTFNDVVHALALALGSKPSIEYIPMPLDLRGKYQYLTRATTEKLRRAGIRHTFYTLENSVLDYVQALSGAQR